MGEDEDGIDGLHVSIVENPESVSIRLEYSIVTVRMRLWFF